MKVIGYFNNISLKNKLIIFFIMISLVPTLIIGLISYKVSESVIMDKEVDRMVRNLKDADRLVFDYLSGKRYIAIKLSMDDDVTALAGNRVTGGNSRLKAEFQVRRLLNDYRNTDGTQSIYLFDVTGKAYTNDIYRLADFESIIFNKWYHETLLHNVYMWGDARELNGVYAIPFYRIIRDLQTGKPVGLVILNIREDYIYQLYSKLEEPSGEILVFNQNRRVASGKDKLLLGHGYDDIFGKKTVFPGNQGYFEKSVDNVKYLVTYYRNETMDWTYVGMVRMSLIMSASERIKQITVLISLICLAVTALFSIFLSTKVTKPVKKLVRQIEAVQRGHLDIECNFRSRDEIGLIGTTFDSMLKQIRQSISEIYEAQQKKREAEMRALMNQINPHFLYNTLTSIIWLTNGNKKQEVIDMVSALSTLLRIGISKGREIITVEEEAEHARSYLAIQNIRYRDEFRYEFRIDEAVKRLFTPKIVLQPLIENSIYHGVKNTGNYGWIVVKAYTEGERLVFEVLDNGSDASLQTIDDLNGFLSGDVQKSDYGIGIRNVNDRIRLLFGAGYGLAFSRQGDWTAAKITLPVQEEPMQVTDGGQATDGMRITDDGADPEDGTPGEADPEGGVPGGA